MDKDLQGRRDSHLIVQDGMYSSGSNGVSILSRAGMNLWVQRSGSDVQTLAMSALMSIILMLIVMNVHWHFLERRRRGLLPPGPRPYPIVGNIFDMAGKDGLPHRALRSLAAKFGGLMYLRLGTILQSR
jgi:hypothetical protein